MIFQRPRIPSPHVGVYTRPGEIEPVYVPPEVVSFADAVPPDSRVFEPCIVGPGQNAFDIIADYSHDSLPHQALDLLKLVFHETSPYITPEHGNGSIIDIEVQKGHPPIDTSTKRFDPRILHRDHLIRNDEFYGAVVIGAPTVYFAGRYTIRKQRGSMPVCTFDGEPEAIRHFPNANGHLPFIRQNPFTLHQRPAERASNEAFISVVAKFRD